MRRITIALLLAGLAAGAARAQDETDEQKYQHKLEKEFVKKVPWEMKLDDALAKAREQKKLVIGYFSRSYAP